MSLINVRELSTFQRFLRLCAGRTGQLLNLSALATDAGITHNTARAWISVLEASWLIRLLPPHHRNFNKRLVKTAKLYFLDAGLAAWLLGIKDAATVTNHPLRGPLFETWVLGELWKARFNRGLSDGLFFWRDSAGHEVDVILEDGEKLSAIELKSGKTLNADFFQGLECWRTLAGKAASGTSLIYGGDQSQTRNGIRVVPWLRAGEAASVG